MVDCQQIHFSRWVTELQLLVIKQSCFTICVHDHQCKYMCAMYSQSSIIYSSYISILILVSKFSLKNKILDVSTIVAKQDIRPYKLKINALLFFADTLMDVTQKLVVTNSKYKKSKAFGWILCPIFADIFYTKFVI